MWASLVAMIMIIGASGTPIELIPTLVRNLIDRATETLAASKSKPAYKIAVS
jgi:hypothetical protein